jgi:hypothetical protein
MALRRERRSSRDIRPIAARKGKIVSAELPWMKSGIIWVIAIPKLKRGL